MFSYFFKFSFIFLPLRKNKSMNPESCRFSIISSNNDIAMVPYNFDNPINHDDEKYEDDCELPKELA